MPRVKYHMHGKNIQHPDIVKAVKDVFSFIVSSRWKSQMPRVVNVHIWPNVVEVADKNASPCMMQMHPIEGPIWHFSTGGMNAHWVLTPNLAERINKGPIQSREQFMRLFVAHEIGHWLLLQYLAKSDRYGRHPFVAHLFLADKHMKRHAMECHVNRRDADGCQETYRSTYPERWADRYARIMVNHMMPKLPKKRGLFSFLK